MYRQKMGRPSDRSSQVILVQIESTVMIQLIKSYLANPMLIVMRKRLFVKEIYLIYLYMNNHDLMI